MTNYLNLSEARNRNISCLAVIRFPFVSKSTTTNFICLQKDLAFLVFFELACRFGGGFFLKLNNTLTILATTAMLQLPMSPYSHHNRCESTVVSLSWETEMLHTHEPISMALLGAHQPAGDGASKVLLRPCSLRLKHTQPLGRRWKRFGADDEVAQHGCAELAQHDVISLWQNLKHS